MDVNGESIYGTTAGPFERLPWGRCTTRMLPGGNTRLYLHVFDWPEDGELEVPGLHNDPLRAWLLARGERDSLEAEQAEGGVRITVPDHMPNEIDSVVVLEIAGAAEVEPYVIRETAGGVVDLAAIDAHVHGHTARYESGGGKSSIGFRTNPGDRVSWMFRLDRPGRFRVIIEYACDLGNGGTFSLNVAGQDLTGRAKPTGSWTGFVSLELGEIEINHAGRIELAVRPIEIPAGALMNLKSVRLERLPNGDD